MVEPLVPLWAEWCFLNEKVWWRVRWTWSLILFDILSAVLASGRTEWRPIVDDLGAALGCEIEYPYGSVLRTMLNVPLLHLTKAALPFEIEIETVRYLRETLAFRFRMAAHQ